eukprot:TRINITY_DN12849_c0_g1_i1.p1 TRINITY_DN12849_c0_g1~~TRINITY_DN12849_c0_g1_i1.p1  ORF type:complete len:297 (-),score=56.18 TRINITY_DN12849_c0_g1_i1:202-1092(-)
MGHPRMDVQGIIQQLRTAMGAEKGTLYWDTLRRFLLSKLSKREFDHLVVPLLGPEHIPLHNSLIQAILVNAQSGRPAPTTVLTTFSRTEHAKRPRAGLKHKKELKHKHRQEVSRPSDVEPRKSEELVKEHKRKRRAIPCKPEATNGTPPVQDPGGLVEERIKKPRVGLPPSSHKVVGGAGARSCSSLKPRHSYSGMMELEPTEVAYGVRQHVASIGMNTTQESVDYLRYAMQEYVNRIIDACRVTQAEQPAGTDDVIRLPDLHRAVPELSAVLPPWNLAKLFEQSLTHPEQLSSEL